MFEFIFCCFGCAEAIEFQGPAVQDLVWDIDVSDVRF